MSNNKTQFGFTEIDENEKTAGIKRLTDEQ